MNKPIIILLCFCCFSSINGMTLDFASLDTIPQTWQAATPSGTAQRLGLITRNHIHEKWWNGNAGFNISFRQIMGNNFIRQSDIISNWFAACGTLTGIYDQVQINQIEVEARKGYWEQFQLNIYNAQDVNVFKDFKLSHVQYQLTNQSGMDISLMLDTYGPIIIASRVTDAIVVISDIDYHPVVGQHFKVFYFDPAKKVLKAEDWKPDAKSHYTEEQQKALFKPKQLKEGENWYDVDFPAYSSVDRSMIPFETLLYRMSGMANNGPVPVYIAFQDGFNKSLGINQRADDSGDRREALKRILEGN